MTIKTSLNQSKSDILAKLFGKDTIVGVYDIYIRDKYLNQIGIITYIKNNCGDTFYVFSLEFKSYKKRMLHVLKKDPRIVVVDHKTVGVFKNNPPLIIYFVFIDDCGDIKI